VEKVDAVTMMMVMYGLRSQHQFLRIYNYRVQRLRAEKVLNLWKSTFEYYFSHTIQR
jgi:hypothetical protein